MAKKFKIVKEDYAIEKLIGSEIFAMSVTTLSLPSMIMLRKAVKPKLLAIFIGVCTVGIIVVGYFFNLIQPLII